MIAHAETFVADTHTFEVAVTDGQLNLLFRLTAGTLPPIVNAIRVAQLR